MNHTALLFTEEEMKQPQKQNSTLNALFIFITLHFSDYLHAGPLYVNLWTTAEHTVWGSLF